MATISQFEDLQIWKDSRQLVGEIYALTQDIKDFDYNSQIRRAAISIMNNIAEGFHRSGNKEFIRFLNISKTSCGEVLSMLYIAEDLQYSDTDTCSQLRIFSTELLNSIAKFINYLLSHLQ